MLLGTSAGADGFLRISGGWCNKPLVTRRLLLAAALLAGCDLTVHAGGMGGGSGGGSATGGGVATGGGSANGGGSATGGGGSNPAMESGDVCMAAISLTLTDTGNGVMRSTVTGTTAGLNDDDGNFLSSCGGNGAPDIFYRFRANKNDSVTVTVTPSDASLRPIVKVREATHGCNDLDDRCDAATAAGGVAQVSHLVISTSGDQFVVVDGADLTQGAFTLDVQVTPPPDGGSGSCALPFDIGTNYSSPSGATTAGADDAVLNSCGAPSGLPEVVYRTTLPISSTLHLTGSDLSGQGIAMEVRSGDCTGQTAACVWQSNGVLDQMVSLDAGTWVFVLERKPAGNFSFAVQ